MEPNVLLLRSLDHLPLSQRSFSALKLARDTSDLLSPKNESLKSIKNGSQDIGSPKNGSQNIGSLTNGSQDIGRLKVESTLLAATASSPILSNLLKLAFNSTEESYAKDLEEEIERMEGCLVMSDSEERVAVDVEEEEGLKEEEAATGETLLAGMIQAVWHFNNSTRSV